MKIGLLTERVKAKDPDKIRYKQDHHTNVKINKVLDDDRIRNKQGYIVFIEKNLHLAHSFFKEEYMKEMWIHIPEPKLVIYDSDKLEGTPCWDIQRDDWPIFCIWNNTIYKNVWWGVDMAKDYSIKWDMVATFYIVHEFWHYVDSIVLWDDDNIKKYLSYIKQKIGIDFDFNTIKKIISLWTEENTHKSTSIINKYFEHSADYKLWRKAKKLSDLKLLDNWDMVELTDAAMAFWSETHWTWEERYKSFMEWYTKQSIIDSPLIQLFKMFKWSYVGQESYTHEL